MAVFENKIDGIIMCKQEYENVYRFDIIYFIIYKINYRYYLFDITSSLVYENNCYFLNGGHTRRAVYNRSGVRESPA